MKLIHREQKRWTDVWAFEQASRVNTDVEREEDEKDDENRDAPANLFNTVCIDTKF